MPLPADNRPLIVFSHLRWDFVWQRPQHLISRLACHRPAWFIEEPVAGRSVSPRLRQAKVGPLTRIWLEVPGTTDDNGAIYFDDPRAAGYLEQIKAVLPSRQLPPIVWLYTPLALPLAQALDPAVLVYDVMDDLSSFMNAPETLELRHRQALSEADLVFAGGRSLYASVAPHCPGRSFLFASGVEPHHYATARPLRRQHGTPVAGYIGVIDERLDLDLLAGLAASLPEWEIHMVGPVVKVDRGKLPQAHNLKWLGPRRYEQLPEVMAGFDVALMPFALNAATRSISPTKTLEYLAAGLPVVSTRVPDVVASYPGIVDLQDDAPGFAAACRRVLGHSTIARDRKLRPLLERHDWNAIASAMGSHIERVLDQVPQEQVSA
jgi:glycosyltransferase involved in cell wall biosynthesis